MKCSRCGRGRAPDMAGVFLILLGMAAAGQLLAGSFGCLSGLLLGVLVIGE